MLFYHTMFTQNNQHATFILFKLNLSSFLLLWYDEIRLSSSIFIFVDICLSPTELFYPHFLSISFLLKNKEKKRSETLLVQNEKTFFTIVLCYFYY